MIIKKQPQKTREPKQSLKLFTHPVRHVERQTTPQRNDTLEPMQPIDRPPAQKTGRTESGPRSSESKRLERNCSNSSHELKLKMPQFHSGIAIDRPETTNTTLLSILEVAWQEPPETHLINIHKNSTDQTHKNTHTSEPKRKNDVEAQESRIKETSVQVPGSDTENQTRNTPLQCFNDSQQS